MTNFIGQSLGRYHILEQLGEGGKATVYKAYDTRLERDVAVKVIRTEKFTPEVLARALKRFEREAKALARLTHANIVKVNDYGEYEGRPYLVMPYLPGGNLKQLLKEHGRLPWQEAVKLLLPIARALDYAHSQNVIHRDVKPSNILITASGDPMLTDFGVAKIIEEEITVDLTGTGMAVGTPEYMAPEQVSSKGVDHRTDIYSLGVVFYEMVTGRRPYEADTPLAVIAMRASEPLPRPKQFVSALPDRVEQVLLKALTKKPEDRYQSMSELTKALEKLTVVSGGKAEQKAVRKEQAFAPASPSRPKKTAWWPWAVGGIATVLILGTFLAIGLLSKMGQIISGSTVPAKTLEGRPVITEAPTIPSSTLEGSPIITKTPTGAIETSTCNDPLGCVTIGPYDPIHIAYLLVVAGPNETLGIDSRNGVEIAIDDVGGKILNHAIKFDGEDGGCSAEGGQAAGTKLAADPTIVAVIGTSCSSEARAALPMLSSAGFAMVSPSNTAPDLTEAGNSNNCPGYLRTAHNDLVQGAAAAKFAWEFLKVTKAATIHDGSLYADKLQQVFAEEFKKMGGTITLQTAVDPNQTDMSSVLADIATGQPEMIYFPIFLPAGGLIIRQAKITPGLENTYLIGADGLFSPDLVSSAGNDVVGFMQTSPDFTAFGSDYNDKFLPAYKAKFGTVPISIFHAHSYDAFMMIKAAIEKVAVVDADGTLHIGRQALRDALFATKDFKGLTGNLTCTPTGDCADPHIAVYKYNVAQYPPRLIWQLNP